MEKNKAPYSFEEKSQMKFRIPASLALFGVMGFLCGMFVHFGVIGGKLSFPEYSRMILLNFIPPAIAVGFLMEYFLTKLNKALPWSKSMIIRYSAGFTLSIVIAVLLIILWYFLLHLQSIFDPPPGYTFMPPFSAILKLGVILFFLLMVYNLLHMAMYSYRKFFIHSVKLKRMTAEQMNLHIEALKNQLTPHFLFNNLNTVSGLIYSDKRLAENYIRKFSRSCHFIMQNSTNMLIRLEEEIEFVKDYFFLMQTRFPEKMELEVDLGPCHDAGFLPPLSIQLLVENAIKHNPFSGDGLLRIKIYCQDKYYLVVENNLSKSGISIAQSVKSTGIGLQNLKERFFYLTKLPVTVERGTDFKVKLPILKNKNYLYEEKFA